MPAKESNKIITACQHCGDDCTSTTIINDGYNFCCHGCVAVYSLIQNANLSDYYENFSKVGLRPSETQNIERSIEFEQYEQQDVLSKLLLFQSENRHRVALNIPEIHCISCVWLLERLSEFTQGILAAEVNLERKQLLVDYQPKQAKLSEILYLLSQLGYTAHVRNKRDTTTAKQKNKDYLQLAVAGFAFGNVMFLAIPDFFNTDFKDSDFYNYFPYISFVFSSVALFFAAPHYLKSAFSHIRKKLSSMDIPIAIGLLTLYLYSIYDVIGNSGVGYFDSLTGFIFFLQISRIFQKKAFDSLEFQKDASDLLPLVVRKKIQDEFVLTPIQALKEDDIIHLRKNELLPCDSILISDHIDIDNSYITGESDAIRMSIHAHVYAGSRVMSQSAFFRVQKESDQSYLSILWRQAKNDSAKGASRLIDKIAPSFITAVLSIAAATFVLSLIFNLTQPVERVISVLIVACPCALALSAPFAFGTLSSVLAKHGFYFRETTDLEQLADVKTIIFDKTGTITQPDQKKVRNNLLTPDYNALIAATCKNSLHPLSQMIFSTLDDHTNLSSEFWEEIPHRGIRAVVNDTNISVGSWQWLTELQTAGLPSKAPALQSVFVSVDQRFIGHFEFSYPIRSGFKAAWQKLAQSVNCVILSGDNSAAAANCAAELGAKNSLAALSPSAKKEWIQNLPKNETPTLMFGDGMNDSSALAVSTIGVSVIENHSFFSPSADAIIEGKQLQHLPYFLKLSRITNSIFRSCLLVSLIYNLVGLYFAITGQLTPFISGILMPLSSITIIALSFGLVQIYYHITKAELK